MLLGGAPFINEQFLADQISPVQLDTLLADGWRHFGGQFFRYSYAIYESDIRLVIPLRIRLDKFHLSKSQRRTLRRNHDLTTLVRPVEITDEAEQLFHRHKSRFRNGTPVSIYDFLSRMPSTRPCKAREIAVYSDQRLIAVSYFDIGATAISGIYAMFEPEESHRRLGIFTMLKEIETSIGSGKTFYYQGYSYDGPSFYDYKKQFRGSEGFDWLETWKEIGAQTPISHSALRDDDRPIKLRRF
jgi:arginine-tRNA-protein transferase